MTGIAISLFFCIINISICISVRNEIIKNIEVPITGIDYIDEFTYNFKQSLYIDKDFLMDILNNPSYFYELFLNKYDDVSYFIENFPKK